MTPVRAARAEDLPVLQEIERSAGRAFVTVGMDAIADDPPPDLAELAVYAEAGRAWVVPGPDDVPLAYLLTAEVDGRTHVEQVSVHADAAGRGLGRTLVDHARRDGPVTLTTYAEVPWNAPYYARLGFRVLPPEQQGPGLRAVVAAEAARGLARWPRVAMLG